MKVTVVNNGAKYVYPDGPTLPNYFVDFRADGSVVFHLGTIWTPAETHLNLTAHHASIEAVFDADLTDHWWGAHWTYRPKPLRAVRSPAQIVAMRGSFPFGDTGVKVTGPSKPATFKGPMDTSTVTLYMPTTGERGDIGHITDVSAWWMLGNAPDSMFAWAQAGESCTIYFRDENTGRPIDLIKYPTANCYYSSAQGKPWIRGTLPEDKLTGFPGNKGTNPWSPQEAHFCDMYYMAFMASQDLNILEGLQYAANFMLLNDNAISVKQKKAVLHGEYRGLAWAFGLLFKAWFATKDAESRGPLPAFLHPSSYWQTLIDQSADYYLSLMTGPLFDKFSLMVPQGHYSPWMHDYLCTTMGLGALMGQPKAALIFNKIIKNNIDRASGESGYPWSATTSYRLSTCEPGADGKGDLKNPPLADWSAVFKARLVDPEAKITQAKYDQLLADPSNGGVPITGGYYINESRAVFAMADYLDKNGIVPVRATHPDFDLAYGHILTLYKNYGHPYLRTAVVSTAPPSPPPQPKPATGVKIMAETLNLKVGNSVTLTLEIIGGALKALPTWSTRTPATAALAPSEDGLSCVVTATAPGAISVEVDGDGETHLSDTVEGVVPVPLATGLKIHIQGS